MGEFENLRPEGWEAIDESEQFGNQLDQVEIKEDIPNNWIKSDDSNINSYIPKKLINTKYEDDAQRIQGILTGQKEKGFDKGVDLDRGDLNWSLQAFKGLSPEQASKVQRIAKDQDIPFEQIAGNKEVWNQWQEAEEIYKSLLERQEDGSLKYPITAKYLSKPEKMAQAKDDIQTMKEIEALLVGYDGSWYEMGAHALKAGLTDLKMSGLNVVRAANDVIGNYAKSVLEVGEFLAPKGIFPGQRTISQSDILKGITEGTGEVIEKKLEDLRPAELPSETQTKIGRFGYDFTRSIPQVAGSIGVAATGGVVPAGGFIFSHIFGSTYGSLVDKGVDPERAVIASAGNALAQSALESVGLSSFLGMFKSTSSTVVRSILTNMVTEYGTEWLQSYPELAAQIYGEAEIKGQNTPEQIAEFIQRIPEATIQGLYEGALTLPLSVLGGAGKLSYEYGKRKQSVDDIGFYQQLSNLIQKSKLRNRNQEESSDLVSQMIDNSNAPKNVYINLDSIKTYFQEDQEGYNEFVESFGLDDQVLEAESTGKELELDSAKLATKYAGTDFETALSGDYRFNPQGNTKNELDDTEALKQTFAGQIADLAQELERLQTNEKLDPDIEARINSLKESLMTPRKEGGIALTAPQADASLSLLVEGGKVLSRKRGETLNQWFERVNPTIELTGEKGPRGTAIFKQGETIIELFENADRSTFLHETGHIFANEVAEIIKAGTGDEQLKADYEVMKEFAGGDFLEPGAEIEKLMKGFETYLAEGKAPSLKLASAFDRFKSWLTNIYKALKGQRIEINDDLRAVFDRLLAAEADIQDAEAFYKATRSLADLIEIPEAKLKSLEKKKKNTHDEAVKIQVAKYMKVYIRNQGGKSAIAEQAKEYIESLPVYQIIDSGARFNPEDIDSSYGSETRKALAKKGLIGRPTGKAKEKTLSSEVLSLGGIDPNTLDSEARKKFKENKISGVLRKNGIGLDVVAENLVNSGLIQVPSNMNPGDYVQELLLSKYVIPAQTVQSSEGQFVSAEELAITYEGYNSPDEVIKDLVNADSKAVAIKKHTETILQDQERQFLEDISKSESVAGDEAFHNDFSLEYLLAELEILSEKVDVKAKSRNKQLELLAYKTVAQETIGKTPINRASRYDLYAKSEQKHSKESYQLVKDGDLVKATEIRKKQILSHAMVQEAIKARDLRKDMERRYATKQINSKLKSTEFSYVKVVTDLIATYGLNNSKDFIAKEGVIDLSVLDETVKSLIPQWIIAKSKPNGFTDWKDLTVDEVKELNDSIQTFLAYGTEELKTIKDDLIKTKDQLVAAAKIPLSTIKPVKNVQYSKAFRKNIKKTGDGILNHGRMTEFIFDEMDDFEVRKTGKFGVHRRLLFNKSIEAATEEERIASEVKTLADPAVNILYNAAKRIKEDRGSEFFDVDGLPVHPDLIQLGDDQWTAEKLISLLLNSGNEGNLQAIENYYGYTPEIIDSVFKLFTTEEIQAMQKMLDSLDTLYQPLTDVTFNLTNRKPPKVEALSREVVSRDGESIKFEGGYYPIQFDHRLSDASAKQKDLEELQNRSEAIMRTVKAKDGFTKSRKPGHSLPINLSMDVFLKHINDTAHFISHAEFLRDASAIINDKEWSKEVKLRMGNEAYVMIKGWLEHIARPEQNRDIAIYTKFLKFMKNKASIHALGGIKLSTGIKQRTSIFGAVNKHVTTRDIISAIKEVGVQNSLLGKKDSDVWNHILSVSAYIRTRTNGSGMNQAMKEFRQQLVTNKRVYEIAGRKFTGDDLATFAFEWIQLNDRATVGVVWTAAYNAARDMQRLNMNHDDAVLFADAHVRTTQPSGLATDLSLIQREDGWLRLFTPFMTYTLKHGNMQQNNIKAFRKGALSSKDFVKQSLYQNVISPWAAMIITAAFASGEVPEHYEWITSILEFMLSPIPIAREIPAWFKYNRAAGQVNTFEGVNRTIRATQGLMSGEKEWYENLWSLGYAAEFFTNVPALGTVKSLYKSYDIITGKED